jgi:hypothetical protein
MGAVVFEGVNIPWVREKLQNFLEQTASRYATDEYGHSVLRVGCGRDRFVELMEVTEPILNRLYPAWRQENSDMESHEDGFEPYTGVRDAARRLIVRLDMHAELAENLGGTDTSPQISAARLHPLIWQAASAQWSTGHRHEAVLAAAKAVNSMLQKKTNRRDVSEGDLVKESFSEKPAEPDRSRLRYSTIADGQTARSMQAGVLQFGTGCFKAIRNPIGHLPNDEVELDEQSALERLAALSLLARWIDEASLETAVTSQEAPTD